MEETPNMNKKPEISPEKIQEQEISSPKQNPATRNENQKSIPENFNVEEFAGLGKKLSLALNQREEENLPPLLEPEYIGSLYRGFTQLEEAIQSNSPEEADYALNIIGKVFDEVGHASTRSGTDDNIESLEGVGHILDNLGESADNLNLKSLASLIDDKKRLVRIKAQTLGGY